MTRKTPISGFAWSLVALMLAVGSGAAWAGEGHGGTEEMAGQPGKADWHTRTVRIVMLDTAFQPATVTVGAGETVRFAVRNVGALVHEFTIGTEAMQAAHRQEMREMAESGILEPDRINRDRMGMGGKHGHVGGHDEPGSLLLQPGEAGELVWKFGEPAPILFACNAPGHYEAGMWGRILFK